MHNFTTIPDPGLLQTATVKPDTILEAFQAHIAPGGIPVHSPYSSRKQLKNIGTIREGRGERRGERSAQPRLWFLRWARAAASGGSEKGPAASASATTQRSSTAGASVTSRELVQSSPTANAAAAAATKLALRLPRCRVHCSAALRTHAEQFNQVAVRKHRSLHRQHWERFRWGRQSNARSCAFSSCFSEALLAEVKQQQCLFETEMRQSSISASFFRHSSGELM